MDMSNWQEWIAICIVGACFGYILYKAYKLMRCIRQKENPCEHCTSHCILKKQKKNAKIVGDSKKSTTFASANLDKGYWFLG